MAITDIKIADFGLAAKTEPGGTMSTICGTPQYVAPEVIKVRGGLLAAAATAPPPPRAGMPWHYTPVPALAPRLIVPPDSAQSQHSTGSLRPEAGQGVSGQSCRR